MYALNDLLLSTELLDHLRGGRWTKSGKNKLGLGGYTVIVRLTRVEPYTPSTAIVVVPPESESWNYDDWVHKLVFECMAAMAALGLIKKSAEKDKQRWTKKRDH